MYTNCENKNKKKENECKNWKKCKLLTRQWAYKSNHTWQSYSFNVTKLTEKVKSERKVILFMLVTRDVTGEKWPPYKTRKERQAKLILDLATVYYSPISWNNLQNHAYTVWLGISLYINSW